MTSCYKEATNSSSSLFSLSIEKQELEFTIINNNNVKCQIIYISNESEGGLKKQKLVQADPLTSKPNVYFSTQIT